MKCHFFVLCLMIIMIAMSSVDAARKRLGSTCSLSKECCSRYCRAAKCIRFGDAADDKGQRDPCKPNPCADGEYCVYQEVQCIQFPCPPVAQCERRK